MKFRITICCLLIIFITLNIGCDSKKKQSDVYEPEKLAETECMEEVGTEIAVKTAVEEAESVFEEYSYYLDADCKVLPWIRIPEDRQKEGRINEMLQKRYDEVIPTDIDLLGSQVEVKVTYRSERYLCFECIYYSSLPENYDENQLKFTIDIEREKLIDYPVVEEDAYWWRKKFFTHYNLHREGDENIYNLGRFESEQDELWGETGYELWEQEIDFSGITIPCAQIKGMKDVKLQEKINLVLREPFEGLSQCVDWEEYREHWIGAKLSGTQVYVTYKSEQWVSVLYSVDYMDSSKWGGGKAEFGVTVNMKTGERCMLDDLIDINAYLEWRVINYVGDKDERQVREALESTVLTEPELIQDNYDYVENALTAYSTWRDSFYLSPGRLVMRGTNFADIVYPLPEIYEWLKVDPWYGDDF